MTPIGLALALAAAPAEAADAVRRHALLVGANDGGPERATLRYAHDDARTVRGVLTGLGGVDAADADLLLDPDPAALDRAFEALAAELAAVGGRSEVVFYYSGHSDEEGLLLGGALFPYRDLRARLDALPARVRVAILDSCASGAMIRAKGGRKVPPFLADESTEIGGFAYITSSSEDEVAQEADRIGGSYFTHYLASGLRGAADRSQDGRVTLTEAYSYAYDETLARTERTQHGPQHAAYDIQLSGTGDLVLTDLSLVDATLVLAAGLEGQVLVREESLGLVAETLKPPGREVALGVGAGNYQVTVIAGGRYALADLVLAPGGEALLAPDGLSWRLGEVAVARGDGAGGPPTAVVAPAPTGTAPLAPGRNGARFSVLPGIPDPPATGTDTMVLALVAERSQALDGLAVAGAVLVVEGPAEGAVGAFGATSVGELGGLQASFGLNRSAAGGDGLQVSMGANLTEGGFDGLQSTVGLNLARGGVRGGQLATGANLAPGGVEGLQLAVGANLAGRFSRGWQVSAGFNRAQDLEGLQAAVINLARDLDGVQLGLVNVGRDVDGVQIGLVNVARDVDGLPLGLLSFVKEGRHDLLLSASETDLANVEIKLGGDTLYTSLAGGGTPDRHAYAAMGLGAHLPVGRPWLDLDLSLAAYVPTGPVPLPAGGVRQPFDEPPTGVVRGRVTLGVQALPELAPFVGVSLNGRLPVDYPRLEVAPAWLGAGGTDVWGGFFAGLQF